MRRVKYWLPPLLWMGFLFPLWNRLLSSPFLYRLNDRFWHWLVEDMSRYRIGLYYIYLRRSLHVVAYALMAYLIYRFFRGGEKRIWKNSWAGITLMITIGYGCLDEILQSFLKPRNASFMDVVMDSVGTLGTLIIVYIVSLTKEKRQIESRE